VIPEIRFIVETKVLWGFAGINEQRIFLTNLDPQLIIMQSKRRLELRDANIAPGKMRIMVIGTEFVNTQTRRIVSSNAG
jgi:hypothetical protein